MTLQDLGSIGELLAAVATLLTLAYLAIQVKHAKTQLEQSTQQARTAFTMEVGDRSADAQLAWLSADGPRATMTKALLTEDKLQPEEAYEFSVRIAIFFGSLIQSEMLARHGLVEREFLETRYSIYKPYLEMPRVRRWWKTTGTHFYGHDEYAKVIDQLVLEIEEKQRQ
jgi:hypothetical protein